jgi:hypothetical protein
MLNLAYLADLDKPESEQEKKLMWHHIETSGTKPGAMAHHTSVVHNEKMYLFGGSHSNNIDNSKLISSRVDSNFYQLDLKSFKWEVVNSVIFLIR